MRGWMRPATCELVVESIGTAARWPNSQARKITAAAPARTMPTERSRLGLSARTMARTMPRIGVISGATIMAPMTVAVESLITPAVAITADSRSSIQKRVYFRLARGPSKKSWSRMRTTSSAVTAAISRAPGSSARSSHGRAGELSASHP